MAAVDTFTIEISGRGGHGAMPEESQDPIIAALSIGQALNTIVSRNIPSMNQAVLSLTQIHTGTASNVIPGTAYMNGTIRTFDPEIQETIHKRIREIAQGQAASFGVSAEVTIDIGYPATVNSEAETDFAISVAQEIIGAEHVEPNSPPTAGAEDFAYMLQERPGAYLFMGQGPGAGLHHPEYNFNDEAAPFGASYFARVVETAQPVKAAK